MIKKSTKWIKGALEQELVLVYALVQEGRRKSCTINSWTFKMSTIQFNTSPFVTIYGFKVKTCFQRRVMLKSHQQLDRGHMSQLYSSPYQIDPNLGKLFFLFSTLLFLIINLLTKDKYLCNTDLIYCKCLKLLCVFIRFFHGLCFCHCEERCNLNMEKTEIKLSKTQA